MSSLFEMQSKINGCTSLILYIFQSKDDKYAFVYDGNNNIVLFDIVFELAVTEEIPSDTVISRVFGTRLKYSLKCFFAYVVLLRVWLSCVIGWT